MRSPLLFHIAPLSFPGRINFIHPALHCTWCVYMKESIICRMGLGPFNILACHAYSYITTCSAAPFFCTCATLFAARRPQNNTQKLRHTLMVMCIELNGTKDSFPSRTIVMQRKHFMNARAGRSPSLNSFATSMCCGHKINIRLGIFCLVRAECSRPHTSSNVTRLPA